MAEIFVRNSLNSRKAVRFITTIKQFVLTGTDGDHKWVLEVGTTHPDADGNPIPPRYVNLITLDNLNEEAEKLISSMCELIDWSVLEGDKQPPYIVSAIPTDGSETAISSNIEIVLKDKIPSSGIDMSNATIKIHNGTQEFDITNEVEIDGDPYEYKLTWKPALRVHRRYS